MGWELAAYRSKSSLLATTVICSAMLWPSAVLAARAPQLEARTVGQRLAARLEAASRSVNRPASDPGEAIRLIQFIPWNNFVPQFANFPNFPNAPQFSNFPIFPNFFNNFMRR